MVKLLKQNTSGYEHAKLLERYAATNLEQIVANTCFCKLREQCLDKSSAECLKHRNIYQEFMQAKR